jgi:hypothetical protein
LDYSELDTSLLTASEVYYLVSEATQKRDQVVWARFAYLVARDLEYGLVRMWEAYIEGKWDVLIASVSDHEKKRFRG